MKMTCKGICENYKSTLKYRTRRYSNGEKRCSYCDIFIKTESVKCPCCGYNLRYSPKNPKGRKKISDAAKRI